MVDVIASPKNPLIQGLRDLHDAAGRRAAGVFLVEGQRAISSLIAAGWTPRTTVVREDLLAGRGWPEPVTYVSARALAAASAAQTPSGYLATFALPAPAVLDASAGGLIAVGVQDPGNLGTLLRSAAAFGLGQVLLIGGADPWQPKVIQATAGSLPALAIRRVTGPDAAATLALGITEVTALAASAAAPLVALVATDGQAPAVALAGPARVWLVVGAEGDGLPADILTRCDRRMTLPMPGRERSPAVESLNAGVAGSIACYLAAVR